MSSDPPDLITRSLQPPRKAPLFWGAQIPHNASDLTTVLPKPPRVQGEIHKAPHREAELKTKGNEQSARPKANRPRRKD